MVFGMLTFVTLSLMSVGARAAVIDEKIEAEIETIVDARIKLFEHELGNLYEEALKADGKCFLEYGDSCFFAIPVGDGKINREAARLSCEINNAKLANVYSSDHYDQLMTNLRPWIATKKKGTGGFLLYTGMTFDPTSKEMKLSDGSQAPYLKWSRGYPSSGSSATAVNLAVFTQGSPNNGMRNIPPSYPRFGALCEISIDKNLN